MTVYVETDFLVAIVKDADWLQGEAERALTERDVRTSILAYLELLLVVDDYDIEYTTVAANLLDIVPVDDDTHRQIILKAGINHDVEGLTPFDAFHAATVSTWELPVLSSEQAYDRLDIERLPLEPPGDDDA